MRPLLILFVAGAAAVPPAFFWWSYRQTNRKDSLRWAILYAALFFVLIVSEWIDPLVPFNAFAIAYVVGSAITIVGIVHTYVQFIEARKERTVSSVARSRKAALEAHLKLTRQAGSLAFLHRNGAELELTAWHSKYLASKIRAIEEIDPSSRFAGEVVRTSTGELFQIWRLHEKHLLAVTQIPGVELDPALAKHREEAAARAEEERREAAASAEEERKEILRLKELEDRRREEKIRLEEAERAEQERLQTEAKLKRDEVLRQRQEEIRKRELEHWQSVLEKYGLYDAAASAAEQDLPLEHILVKADAMTSDDIASAVAGVLRVGLILPSEPIRNGSDLASLLARARERDVVHIAGVHELSSQLQDKLVEVLRDHTLTFGEKQATRQIPYPPFTIIGSTSKALRPALVRSFLTTVDATISTAPVVDTLLSPSTTDRVEQADLVDVNTATEEQLVTSGLFIADAKRVVQRRTTGGPFRSEEEFYAFLKAQAHVESRLRPRLRVTPPANVSPANTGRLLDL